MFHWAFLWQAYWNGFIGRLHWNAILYMPCERNWTKLSLIVPEWDGASPRPLPISLAHHIRKMSYLLCRICCIQLLISCCIRHWVYCQTGKNVIHGVCSGWWVWWPLSLIRRDLQQLIFHVQSRHFAFNCSAGFSNALQFGLSTA